jgi:hypothetical protein
MCNRCEVITRQYAAVGRVLAWNEQIFSSSPDARPSDATSYRLARRQAVGHLLRRYRERACDDRRGAFVSTVTDSGAIVSMVRRVRQVRAGPGAGRAECVPGLVIRARAP